MKKILAAGFCICLLLIMNSCKKKDENSLKIMHYGGKYEIKQLDGIIEDLKKTYGIDAVQDRAPAGNSYIEKLLIRTAGGSAPDVMTVDTDMFREFALRGALVDLNPFIAADKMIDLKKYYPEIIDSFTVDGKLYALPRDISPDCVIYYNKTAFKEAGLSCPKDDWNTDDFLKTAEKLTKKDSIGRFSRYGFADDGTMWESWVYSFGGALVDNVKNPSKCILDSKKAIEAIQFRADLINKYKVMPFPAQIVQPKTYDASEIFASGRTAMFYGTLNKAVLFRDVTAFEWDVVMFPRGPNGLRGFSGKSTGYAIMKSSAKHKEAWIAVKMLVSEKLQMDLSKKGLLQPAIMKIAASEAFLNGNAPENKKIVVDSVKNIIFPPVYSRWEEIRISCLLPALDSVWNGTKTAEQAMKKTVPEINMEFFNK